MTSLNDVLLAMSNIPIDDPIAETWGRGLQGGHEIVEYTGALPITISADGSALIDYQIYGNTVQDGTPTPENPVDVVGCGERTKNLWNFQPSTEKSGVTLTWNGAKIVFSGICTLSTNLTKSITLSAGTYTIKANANRVPVEDDNSCVDVYKASPYMMAKIFNRNAINGIANFTLGEETTVSLRIRVQAAVNYDGFTLEPMLNLGSTPLPYEPYGYKLPMTVSDGNTVQTVPVYLGEVETTRRIKKLELTGTENIAQISGNAPFAIYLSDIANTPDKTYTIWRCSHYQAVSTDETWSSYNSLISRISTTAKQLCFRDTSIATLADFKTYLQQQYAAGTPVTVWYVLTEPETGIVNEPLMKIGDYADTLSMEQADVSIPTIAGTTVIDYDGTPKPSQMCIKYRR